MRVISAKRFMVASFALMIGLAGCASGSGGSGGGGANRLTADDLVNQQGMDLFQAISQLRGRWLAGRGGGVPGVHVDGRQSLGGVDELRNISVSDVQEVEYLSASDATSRFGMGYQSGAIIVTTRR